MNKMQNLLKKLAKKQYGATMVEYALMLALIAIVSIVMITGLGKEVNNTFNKVNSALSSANAG
jgi:pilus assembly protein Flp/PilA